MENHCVRPGYCLHVSPWPHNWTQPPNGHHSIQICPDLHLLPPAIADCHLSPSVTTLTPVTNGILSRSFPAPNGCNSVLGSGASCHSPPEYSPGFSSPPSQHHMAADPSIMASCSSPPCYPPGILSPPSCRHVRHHLYILWDVGNCADFIPCFSFPFVSHMMFVSFMYLGHLPAQSCLPVTDLQPLTDCLSTQTMLFLSNWKEMQQGIRENLLNW